MSEFVLCTVDDARRMVHWLARRRRLSPTALVRMTSLRSLSVVNFANLDEATQRTRDTTVGAMIQLVEPHEHRLLARPCGAKHLQVHQEGAVPLEIRGAGGGLLEIPLDSMDDLRTLGRTMIATSGKSLSALARKAGVSLTFVTFAKGGSRHQDVSLRIVLETALAGGFELVVQSHFANRREARLADKLRTTP